MRVSRALTVSLALGAISLAALPLSAAPPVQVAPQVGVPAPPITSPRSSGTATPTTTTCAQDIRAAATRLEKASAAFVTAVKNSKMTRDAAAAASKVAFAANEQSCCLSIAASTSATAGSFGVLTPMPAAPGCATATPGMAFFNDEGANRHCANAGPATEDALRALLARSDVSEEVKQAARELRDAVNAYREAVERCKATPTSSRTSSGSSASTLPPPPSAKPPGGACASASECQPGLVCQAGKCTRIGVPLGAGCDTNQLCGPGLECRGGVCRLPCGCPLDCTLGESRCSREVSDGVATIVEDCGRTAAGLCPASCYVDLGGKCRRSRVEARHHTESCSLICP